MNADVDLTNICLETDRLYIRPWRLEDLEDFYEYAKVDGVGQMAGWNPHSSIDESKNILEIFIAGKFELALVLKENNKAIGSLGIEKISFDLGEPYTSLKGREIGYVLSKTYWGKGIMPEAVKEVIDFCFMKENYDFLLCSHFVDNSQSRRVIEKCGFMYVNEHLRKGVNGVERMTRYYVLDNPIISHK